jgi:tetratricopeptide (TPR) repeat protein
LKCPTFASLNDNVGDVLVKQDKLDEALASYKDGLAIRQALAAKDPSNTRWQRDPSVSNDKIGDVLVKQDKLDDALASYKVSLAIAHALAVKDPSNTQWQRDLSVSDDDLSVSDDNIGYVLVKQDKQPLLGLAQHQDAADNKSPSNFAITVLPRTGDRPGSSSVEVPTAETVPA